MLTLIEEGAGLRSASALGLAALLAAAILTVSAPARLAVPLFEAGVLALSATWAYRCALRPYPLEGHWLIVPIAAAAAWPLAQLCAGSTVYRFATQTAAMAWAANLAVFLLALQVFSRARLREDFLTRLAWFGAVLAAVSFLQLYTSEGRIFWIFPTPYRDLVLGPFVYRNHYAAFVELVFPVVLVRALEDNGGGLWWAGAAGLMVASAAAGGSRAGTALLLAEAGAVLALQTSRPSGPSGVALAARRRRFGALRPATVFSVAACGILVVIGGGGFLPERLREADPLVVRRELMQSSVAMVRDRPWAGSGLGTWPGVYPGYALFDNGLIANHAHCDWLEWAAEGGVPFAALLAVVAGGALVLGIRRPWSLGAASVFAHSLVDYPMQKPALAALAFALLAASAAARRRKRAEASEPAGVFEPVNFSLLRLHSRLRRAERAPRPRQPVPPRAS